MSIRVMQSPDHGDTLQIFVDILPDMEAKGAISKDKRATGGPQASRYTHVSIWLSPIHQEWSTQALDPKALPRGWNSFSSVDTTKERSSMQRLMEKQTKGCSVLARWRTRVRKRSGWPSMTLACRLIRNQQEKVRPPGGGKGLGAPSGRTEAQLHTLSCQGSELRPQAALTPSHWPAYSTASDMLHSPRSCQLHQAQDMPHDSCQDKKAHRKFVVFLQTLSPVASDLSSPCSLSKGTEKLLSLRRHDS